MSELADLKTRLREMRNRPEEETPESIRVVAGWALEYLEKQAPHPRELAAQYDATHPFVR